MLPAGVQGVPGVMMRRTDRLVHLAPMEPVRVFVVTPDDRISLLPEDRDVLIYEQPHGLWKKILQEDSYVMVFSTAGTLSQRPQGRLFAKLPFITSLLRDHQHQGLVAPQPEVAVVSNTDALDRMLHEKYCQEFRAPMPCIQKLFFWLHPGRPAEGLSFPVDARFVWSAFGDHGNTDVNGAISPAHGTHVCAHAQRAIVQQLSAYQAQTVVSMHGCESALATCSSQKEDADERTAELAADDDLTGLLPGDASECDGETAQEDVNMPCKVNKSQLAGITFTTSLVSLLCEHQADEAVAEA
jgi:hypothetical protein